MKALYFSVHGGIEQLQYGELPKPSVSRGHVIVRVRACALNHLDLWVLRGWKGLKLSLPHIGGADIAGEIAELGDDITDWKIGDAVAVSPGFLPNDSNDEWSLRGEDSLSPNYQIFGETCLGGFAEFVKVPKQCLLKVPEGVSFQDAAAPLLAGTTAWRMLKHRAKVQAGETVLIVGAGGGVNSFAICLASQMGCNVIALTSSEQKARKAKALGANTILSYREHPEWSKEIKRLTTGRGVDVVVDNVGAASFMQSLRSLCPGGRLVTVGNTTGATFEIDNRFIFAKQLSILGSTMGTHRDFLEAAEFAWKQAPGTFIDRQIPLQNGQEGYLLLEQGTKFGKLILNP